MADRDATPETDESPETPEEREGPGRLISMQEIYEMGGMSPEEAQRRTEEHEVRARMDRVNALVEDLIDALGVRDTRFGVTIAIGGDEGGGSPPTAEELAEMLSGGGGGCPGDCGGECPGHKAASLVADALAKVGTSAGAARGWDTKNQFQPPKPATEELETPDAERPPDTVQEVDTAAKAISTPEASERSKKGWATRRKKGGGVLGRLMQRVPGMGKKPEPKPAYGPGASLDLPESRFRVHAEDEATPGEVEAAMKSLAEDAVGVALERALIEKHAKGYKLQMTEEELSDRAKKAWASRKKGAKTGEAKKPEKAPAEEKPEPKAPAAPAGGPKAEAPAAEAAPAEPGKLSLDDLTKVGSQMGSNPGGVYRHPETGEQYYVKTPKTDEHAKNEALAARLYELAGVAVPEVQLVDVNGKQGVASKMVDGLSTGSKQTDWAGVEGAHEGFAADAWLANWDVVGLEWDNLHVDPDGKAMRLDTGGALQFRAQGAPKGAHFGNEVGELESLRDPHLNAQSAAVFGQVSDEALEGGVARVLAVTDDQIDAAVAEFGPKDGEALAAKLKARRDHMGSLFPGLKGGAAQGSEAPTTEPEVPTASTPSAQVAEAAEALAGFHMDVYTPTGDVAEALAQAKAIGGRVVATQAELEDAHNSYNGWSDKDDMRAAKAKSDMKWTGKEPLNATRLMADKITNPEKAFRRGYAYHGYGMPEAAKLLFHRGALLHAAKKAGTPVKGPGKKVKKSNEDSSSALAGLVYPAWARPGSTVAARYDDRPTAG